MSTENNYQGIVIISEKSLGPVAVFYRGVQKQDFQKQTQEGKLRDHRKPYRDQTGKFSGGSFMIVGPRILGYSWLDEPVSWEFIRTLGEDMEIEYRRKI